MLLGFDPMVQLVHVDDVAEAIALALAPGRRGIYNIAGPGEVPLSAILDELGREPRSIPHPLAKPVLSLAFRARHLELPGRRARLHPLRLHGRRSTRSGRAGLSAPPRPARDHPRGGRSRLKT